MPDWLSNPRAKILSVVITWIVGGVAAVNRRLAGAVASAWAAVTGAFRDAGLAVQSAFRQAGLSVLDVQGVLTRMAVDVTGSAGLATPVVAALLVAVMSVAVFATLRATLNLIKWVT
ncbi:hypothetical protein [Halolamina sp.]|uniref:hypothetical protein n=1 Tax=Halolamina sp. TaxID=1940283 RepID=UPI0035682FE3